MKNILALFFTFCFIILNSQESIQGTIRVESPQVASVYVTPPTVVTGPNPSNSVTLNISITVSTNGYATPPSATPTLTGVFNGLALTPVSPYLQSGRFVYTFVVTGSRSTFTWTAGDELQVLDLQFADLVFSNGNFPRLQNDDTGGVGGQSYFYVEVNGNDRTNYSDTFYGGSEGSTPYPYVESLSPLPITIKSFSATKDGERSSRLDWTSSSEINSDFIGIERSTDGEDWTTVGYVKAAGNSNRDIDYIYYDRSLPMARSIDNIFYYRLRLTDLDGQYDYSETRGVNMGRLEGLVSIYPNPATDIINVDLTDMDLHEGIIHLSVYDNTGKAIISKEVNGAGIEPIQASNMAAGTYNVVVKQGDTTHRKQIIVVN